MYIMPNKKLWNDRIDSETDETEFRFHFYIEKDN